jgi:hypothetical protein
MIRAAHSISLLFHMGALVRQVNCFTCYQREEQKLRRRTLRSTPPMIPAFKVCALWCVFAAKYADFENQDQKPNELYLLLRDA